MAERFTFPQSGDNDDAEHFGALIGQDNLTNYVEYGMTFNVSYSVPEVTVTTGKGFVQVSSATASSSGDTILNVGYVIQIPQQTVSLTDNAVNYIYLEPDLSTDDNGTVNAYTSEQTGNSILIGTIDTANNTSTRENRNPAVEFQSIGLNDDEPLVFGSDDDYYLEYDSANDVLSLDDSAGNDLIDFGDGLTTLYNNLDLNGNDLVDGTTTVWDSSAGHIPNSSIQTNNLDADTVDGYDASALAAIAEDETITGAWTFNSNVTFADTSSGNVVLATFGDDAELVEVDSASTVRLRGVGGSTSATIELGDNNAAITGDSNGNIAPRNNIDLNGSSIIGASAIDGSVQEMNIWTANQTNGEMNIVDGNSSSYMMRWQNNGATISFKTINLNGNELTNHVIDTRTSDPSSPNDGQIWYRSDL